MKHFETRKEARQWNLKEQKRFGFMNRQKK